MSKPTSKRARWKPIARLTPEICFNALLFVGDTHVSEADVASWTEEQREIAYDWAMRYAYKASDNACVRVPPRPDFVPRSLE